MELPIIIHAKWLEIQLLENDGVSLLAWICVNGLLVMEVQLQIPRILWIHAGNIHEDTILFILIMYDVAWSSG